MSTDLDTTRSAARAQMTQAAHDLDVEGLFAAVAALGAAAAAAAAADREDRRRRRNAAARLRYAQRKMSGTLPLRGGAAAAAKRDELRAQLRAEEDRDSEHRCGCADPGAMPPCSHCTDCEGCWEA